MRLRPLKNLVGMFDVLGAKGFGFLTIRWVNLFHYGRDGLIAPIYWKPNCAIKAQFACALHFTNSIP